MSGLASGPRPGSARPNSTTSSPKSARLDRDGAYGITKRYAFLRRAGGLRGAMLTDAAGLDARRGWAMWALPALLFLIAFFHRSAPGIIAKDLMHDFNTTGAIVGLLSATYFYAYAGLMIPAGLFVDAFGVRRVVTAGGLVMGFGTVAMGLAATPWALFAARFAVGLGAATTFIGALKVAATWFPPGRFGFLSAVTV